jgi:RNA polymerase sigma-70 factor (ECF subfamily)
LQQLNKMNRMKKTDEDAEYYAESRSWYSGKMEEEIRFCCKSDTNFAGEKLVFNMRYYDDLPYEEISKILDMSVGTLKTNYHYAKDKVEQYIKDNYSKSFNYKKIKLCKLI